MATKDNPTTSSPYNVFVELHEIRESIDNIDAALVHLLAERFKFTQKVGTLKATPAKAPAQAVKAPGRVAKATAAKTAAGAAAQAPGAAKAGAAKARAKTPGKPARTTRTTKAT